MKRKIYLNKVSLEEAKEKYFSIFRDTVLPGEEIDVAKAEGRITTEPIYARRSAPHYYASAMDGIAVKAETTAGASEREPVRLKAGEQAHLIDTGDALPEGFNAVIKIEEVNNKGDYYEIEKGATPWQHVRSIGESVIKGELVLPVNHRLKAYDLGAILEVGLNKINVRKKPVVGIIPTGTELTPPEIEPERGQLTEFNSTIFKAYAEQWGAETRVSGIVRDDYELIKEKLNEIHNKSDITVIIAGSSAGSEDYTVNILEELGEIIVHGINIMPGKPVILAVVDGKPVIGLPGYPISAILNYYIFVRTLINMVSGTETPGIIKIKAGVRRKVPSQIGLEEFIRVNLAEIEGEMVAVPRQRGSAAMKSLLKADGIMTIPNQKEGLPAGSRASVYIIKSRSEIRKNLLFIGSHDMSLDILANLLQENRVGFSLNIQSAGSMAGLMALKRGESHLGGTHLLDEASGEYNKPFVSRILPDMDVALINLVYRKQGLFVARGNPLGINSINDLTRDGLIFINRQPGSGTRVLLDYWLKKEGIYTAEIEGYDRVEYTHINAAAAVAGGSADTALGIMAAARALDLDFIPLMEEKYDIILPLKMLEDNRIKTLNEMIKSEAFKKQVEELGGYRTDESGEIIKIRREQ